MDGASSTLPRSSSSSGRSWT